MRTAPGPIHKRSDLHVKRKIWHFTTVSVMAWIYILLPEWVALAMLLATMLISIPIDIVRQFYKPLNDAMVKLFRPFIRESEINDLAGTTYLLSGAALLALAFPRPVIEMSMLFLAVADPLASYVGIKYGKRKIYGNKSYAGFFAAFLACTAISIAYLSIRKGFSGFELLYLAPLCGLAGAAAETLEFGGIDDNFSLPVSSGVICWALFYSFGAQI